MKITVTDENNDVIVETARYDTSEVHIWIAAFLEGYHFPNDGRIFKGKIEIDFGKDYC